MAILESKQVLSDGQEVTGTALSTNVLDTGVADSNLGDHQQKHVRVQVGDTAFLTLTSLTAALQDSADGITYTDLASGAAVAVADLVPGAKLLDIALPMEHKRYLAVNYTVGGSSATAGNIYAWIGDGVPNPAML